jgi:D-aminopeptidase
MSLNETPSGKPRARGLGIPFSGTPGEWNAITDVPGVEVGYATLIRGDHIRTGVTAIHPRGRANVVDPYAAGIFSQNGNGEMTGWAWIEESGTSSLPITITNTRAVGIAHEAVVSWAIDQDPAYRSLWFLPVAAETFDGYLHDINGGHVTAADVRDALDAARSGPIEEGSVGGGTGMNLYQFKGGNGTASRLVPFGGRTYTVGVLLQCNFGGREELVIAGVPLGAALADDNPMNTYDWNAPPGAGSVIGVLATDAPLLPHQLKALARRFALGIARTGTAGGHFSGDIFLAFSTANTGAFAVGFPEGDPDASELSRLEFVQWRRIDPFLTAAVDAVEEAIVNALVANETMTGRDGNRTPGLPRDRVVELLRERGVV